MKALVVIINITLILIIGQGCNTSKETNRLNDTELNSNQKEYDGSAITNPFIVLSCNGRKGNYSKKMGNMENGDLDLLMCVSKKAYEGDTSSINKIASILPYLQAPFTGSLYPYRGEKLFPIVLNILNDFTITPDDSFCYSLSNMRFLFDMIDQINDMETRDYMDKNMSYPNIDIYDPGSEAYYIEVAKSNWHTINEAYTKGLIKYKPYGQK